MAATLIVEYESGTCTGFVHPHNGYWAGDFSAVSPTVPGPGSAPATSSTSWVS